MSKQIAIMGVGAAGSYIGAFLTRAGYDVSLIDMWGDHVEQMKNNGLRASGSQGDFTVKVKAYHLSDAMQLKQKFDIVFLAVKSYDTEWATHFIKRFLKSDGFIVDSQNCMNDRLVSSIVGYNKVLGCIMSGITVALWEPGHVNRGGQPGRERGHDVFRIGELHGRITPRVDDVVGMMNYIDSSRGTNNLWGERWSKLTINASGNPVGAMTGMGGQTVAANAKARRIQISICKESCQVAFAQNYVVEDIRGITAKTFANADDGEVFEELDSKFMPSGNDGTDWKSSMSQDVVKDRHTEVEFMNGYISEQAKIMGINTPVNDAIVKIVSEIDAGTRKPSPENLDVVFNLAGLT